MTKQEHEANPQDIGKEYEIGFLAKDEQGVREVTRLLLEHKAEVTSEGPVRRILLAYPIRKETHADFGFIRFRFQNPGEDTVKNFTKSLRQTQGILRFLVIKPVTVRKQKVVEGEMEAVVPHRPVAKAHSLSPLSNEALEKTIEEILQ